MGGGVLGPRANAGAFELHLVDHWGTPQVPMGRGQAPGCGRTVALTSDSPIFIVGIPIANDIQ